jgi:spectinomycin phosphotransferase
MAPNTASLQKLREGLLKELLLPQTIIETLERFYGITPNKLTSVAGGADLNAAVYKTDSDTGSYFVKIKRGIHSQVIPTILGLLNKVGIQQVIQPVKTIQGNLAQKVGDFSFIVFPFIIGKNGFNCELTHVQWAILGKTLKEIHSTAVSPDAQSILQTEVYSPQWRNAVRSIYNQIEINYIGEERASPIVQFLIDHRTVIFRLVDRAEMLSEEVQ